VADGVLFRELSAGYKGEAVVARVVEQRGSWTTKSGASMAMVTVIDAESQRMEVKSWVPKTVLPSMHEDSIYELKGFRVAFWDGKMYLKQSPTSAVTKVLEQHHPQRMPAVFAPSVSTCKDLDEEGDDPDVLHALCGKLIRPGEYEGVAGKKQKPVYEMTIELSDDAVDVSLWDELAETAKKANLKEGGYVFIQNVKYNKKARRCHGYPGVGSVRSVAAPTASPNTPGSPVLSTPASPATLPGGTAVDAAEDEPPSKKGRTD